MDCYNIDPFSCIVKEKEPQIEFEISANPSRDVWIYLPLYPEKRIPRRKRIANPYGGWEKAWEWTLSVTNTFFLPPNRRIWVRGKIGGLICLIGGERGCLPIIQRTLSCTDMTFTFTRGEIAYRCFVPPSVLQDNRTAEKARSYNRLPVRPMRVVGNSCMGYYLI